MRTSLGNVPLTIVNNTAVVSVNIKIFAELVSRILSLHNNAKKKKNQKHEDETFRGCKKHYDTRKEKRPL